MKKPHIISLDHFNAIVNGVEELKEEGLNDMETAKGAVEEWNKARDKYFIESRKIIKEYRDTIGA